MEKRDPDKEMKESRLEIHESQGPNQAVDLTKHPHLCQGSYWVAVKELKLSYHDGYI